MRELLTETGEALRAKLLAARDAGRDVMVRRSFATEIKAAGGGTRTIDFVISTAAVDRYGDTIAVDGWKLDNFKKSPVVLWQHDADIPPIAKASNVHVKDGKLLATAEFDDDEFSDAIFRKLKGGFLSATSVGFLPLKYAFVDDPARRFGIDFTEQELLEFSIVTVPAQAEALIIQGRALAQDKRGLEMQLRGLGYSRKAAEKIAAGGFPALIKPDPVATTVSSIKDAATAFRSEFVNGAASYPDSLKGLREKRGDIIGKAEDECRMPNASERAELAKLENLILNAERREKQNADSAVPIT